MTKYSALMIFQNLYSWFSIKFLSTSDTKVIMKAIMCCWHLMLFITYWDKKCVCHSSIFHQWIVAPSQDLWDWRMVVLLVTWMLSSSSCICSLVSQR